MKKGRTDSPTHPLNPQSKPSPSSKSNAALGPRSWQPIFGAWLSEKGGHFRVWAPLHKSIDVVLERSGQTVCTVPLTREKEGTFAGTCPDTRSGDLYRFKIDGQNTYPDPASRFQPQGVHGPSQIIDPAAFTWTDSSWTGVPLEALVIYELHVGTFTPEGTFEAAMTRLPYLQQLGVTTIELMPLADFAGSRNWGYDGVALFAPARCYGSPDALRHFVNAAHEAGIAVLIDVVYNHLGPDGNYTEMFSPFYTTDKHASLWGKGLNFDDEQSAFVREFLIQNALHWIHEYHMDGLRLDATHAIHDTTSPHFLADLSTRIQTSVKGRAVHVIAEDNRNDVSLVKPQTAGGKGLSAVWSDDFHHQVRRILAGDSDGYYADFSDRLEDLLLTLQHGWFYTGQRAPFFNAPRGTDPQGVSLQQFVFFLQNHDQIGNRATGDRLHHTISPAAYRAASALLLSLPQTPLLFMGQEWAASSPFLFFTDHHEELGKLVREGRKKEFASFLTFNDSHVLSDPQAPETFQKSKLIWHEQMKEPHESVWLFYQVLLKLRRDTFAPLQDPKNFAASLLNPSALLLKHRSKEGRQILVVLQMKGAGTVDLTTHPSLKTPLQWDVLLTSEDKTYCPDPMPPVVHLSGEAPVIEFARPGAVFLQERMEIPV